MKRRALLTGIASTAVTSMLVGSGAFTSVAADRRVNVEIADDNQALLAFSERGEGLYPEGGRSNEGGDTVSFAFPGVGQQIEEPELGLGADSVYEFTQDGGEADNDSSEKGLARIENRGTQIVEVYSIHRTDSEIDIELFDVDDPEKVTLREDPAELSVGDYVDIGFRIRTHDAEIGDFDETLTIVANRPDN